MHFFKNAKTQPAKKSKCGVHKNVGILSAFVCQRGIRLIYFYILMAFCH